MRKSLYYLTILFFISNFSVLFSQIKIKELPPYDLLSVDSLFFNISEKRTVIPLNNGWEIYSGDEPNRKTEVNLPSSFEGVDELIYEREISFSQADINNRQVQIKFLGLSYAAEIVLNDLIIYKHPGGLHPFYVIIPDDLVKTDTPNKLIVRVSHKLDDVNTIPLIQGYLFPDNYGGILRDVYLETFPLINIEQASISYSLTENYTTASVDVNLVVKNSLTSLQRNLLSDASYSLRTEIKYNNAVHESYVNEFPDIPRNDLSQASLNFNLENLELWSPGNPANYKFEFSLFQNDSLIDKTSKLVNFYSLEKVGNRFTINGSEIKLKGTTYIKATDKSGRLLTYNELESDLRLIKETGFNSIRFSKQIPHPYALKLCSELGLLAFVELPLTSIPAEILNDRDFKARAEGRLNLLLNDVKNFPAIAGIGLGSGFISGNESHTEFIKDLASVVKNRSNKLIYASFLSLPSRQIENVDLYGLELYSKNPYELNQLQNSIETLGNTNVFISSATYPSYKGNTNGYLNKHSYEAQAKFFRDVINYSEENNLSGFYINTFYNYKGKFSSFYTGYTQDGYYHIGLLRDKNDINSISYKIVKSELLGDDQITIPIGNEKDEAPIFFIVVGLVLSIFMALLINSKRKFREDAGRALMRPYNFFADIRDLRILSGMQTNLLMFILSGTIALVLINLLYYLRSNILLEKILLAFASKNLIEAVLFISWHPVEGFLILWGISIIGFIVLSAVIKFFTVFIKNKVFFSSVFYTVVWSLLPFSLLLPLELVLYRVLQADILNVYIYIFLVLFIIWIFQRLAKGIHVVFEVRSFIVYVYSVVFLVFVTSVILIVYHLQYSTIYYILQAFRDYRYI